MNPCEEMRQFFIKKFHAEGEKVLPVLCSLALPRKLFLSKYADFPPIETLPDDQKKDMKRYVHDMFTGKSVEFKLEAAKIIYTLGNMI